MVVIFIFYTLTVSIFGVPDDGAGSFPGITHSHSFDIVVFESCGVYASKAMPSTCATVSADENEFFLGSPPCDHQQPGEDLHTFPRCICERTGKSSCPAALAKSVVTPSRAAVARTGRSRQSSLREALANEHAGATRSRYKRYFPNVRHRGGSRMLPFL